MPKPARHLGLTGFALGLGMLVVASAPPVAWGQVRPSGGSIQVLEIGPNGGLICKTPDAALASELVASKGPVRLKVFRSTNSDPSRVGLKILLRATSQLEQNSAALLAMRQAAAQWELAIQSPITVVLDVDYGPTRFGSPWPSQNILGSTATKDLVAKLPDGSTAGVADVIQALKAAHPSDEQLQALYNAIPIPTPSTARSSLGAVENLGTPEFTQMNLQALGFLPAVMDSSQSVNAFGAVPNMGYNSAFNWDLDPTDGITPGMHDFQGVVIHEIGHALGFISAIGLGGPPDNLFAAWDLFRVRPDAVSAGNLGSFTQAERVVTPGPPDSETLVEEGGAVYKKAVQAFFDGSQVLELSTSTSNGEGGDGQQASHWRDDALRPPSLGSARKIGIMDPTQAAGELDSLKATDLRMLKVIGWDVGGTSSFSALALTVNGNVLDLSATPDTLELGDLALGASASANLTLTNTHGQNVLTFSVVVDPSTPQPSGATATTSVSPASGEVSVGGTMGLVLAFGSSATRAVFGGVIRISSNAAANLVVEIPYRFTVDGAVRPTATITPTSLTAFSGLQGGDRETRTLTLSNAGNLDLEYEVILSLSAQSFPLTTGTADKRAGQGALERFFGSEAASRSEVLFATDFESDLGGMEATGSSAFLWDRTAEGAATLPGHSLPTAAYFGLPGFGYFDLDDGSLTTPAIDVAGLTAEDALVLTFNYHLRAEEGYDFATVRLSTDDGQSYSEIATSNAGLLDTQTSAWKSAMILLPDLSGTTSPIKVSFRFQSDETETDDGWFIDDVQVAIVTGDRPVFAVPRTGVVPGLSNPEPITLTVKAGPLDRGLYEGTLSVATNDRARPLLSVPYTVEVDAPLAPTLTPDTASLVATVAERAQVDQSFVVTNTGSNSSLKFLRVLEPALSGLGQSAAGMLAERAAASQATGPSVSVPRGEQMARRQEQLRLAQASSGRSQESARAARQGDLPTTIEVQGITQMPNGSLVVTTESGRTFVLNGDLEVIADIPWPLDAGFVSGVTYNEDTGTLWYLVARQVYDFDEVSLTAGTLQPTGQQFQLDIDANSIAYSRELGAFMVLGTDMLYALDTEGGDLPGYPQAIPFGFGSTAFRVFPGFSVTGGVVEYGLEILDNAGTGTRYDERRFGQYDQFGRGFPTAQNLELSPEQTECVNLFTYACGIRGLHRSQDDPNGVLFVLMSDQWGVDFVVKMAPPSLPAGSQSTVGLSGAGFARGLAAGSFQTVTARIKPGHRIAGVYDESVTFLTNHPTSPTTSLPARVTVTGSGSSRPSDFTLLSPADGATDVPGILTLAWGSSAGAADYQVQVAVTSDFIRPLVDTTGVSGAELTLSGVSGGDFWWRVRGRNTNGHSVFTPPWQFTTQAAPTLASPADGAAGTPTLPLLRWDALPGASNYQVQVAEGSAFTTPTTDSVTVSTSMRLPRLSNDRTYFWRVRSGPGSVPSPWSTTRSFRTAIVGPQLLTPADGATGLEADVTLTWTAPSDALFYEAEVAQSTEFATLVDSSVFVPDNSFALSGLDAGTTFYWRIRYAYIDTVSISTVSSDWSTRRFETAAMALAAPQLASPSDGEVITGTEVTLSWITVAGATGYNAQVSTISSFASTIADESTLAATSLSVGGLAPGSTYHWRVRASNAGGAGEWSVARTFITVSGVGVERLDDTLPTEFSLAQNYPNPFNPITRIPFAIPEHTRVEIGVFNAIGEEVARLVDGPLEPGRYQASWDASASPSGVYLYRIRAGSFRAVRTLVLLR